MWKYKDNLSVGLRIQCLLLLGLMCVQRTYGTPKGAPEAACIGQMMPLHFGAPAQTSPVPFMLTIEKPMIMPGMEVKMTLSGEMDTDIIKGFLIVVRNSTDDDKTLMGTWKDGGDENTKIVECNKNEDESVTGIGITHKTRVEKPMAKVIWVAPNTVGKFHVFFTVVKDKKTFWTKQQTPESEIIEVTMDEGAMNGMTTKLPPTPKPPTSSSMRTMSKISTEKGKGGSPASCLLIPTLLLGSLTVILVCPMWIIRTL